MTEASNKSPAIPERKWPLLGVLATAVAVSVAIVSPAARADVLASDTENDGIDPRPPYYGQSVTTPAGGPYTDITFNFYDGSASEAAGDLYIFASPFSGTPPQLASSSPLAEATGAGGVYTFPTSLTLNGATQYYVYADAAQTVSVDENQTYAGGVEYLAALSTFDFIITKIDTDFSFDGVPVATPEPSALPILGAALGLLSFTRLRFRRRDPG